MHCHLFLYLERLLFLIQCLFIPVSAGVQGTRDKQQPPPAPGETAQPGPSPNPAQRSRVQQHEQQQHRQRFRHRPHVAPGKATTNSNFGGVFGEKSFFFWGVCQKKPHWEGFCSHTFHPATFSSGTIELLFLAERRHP